MLTNISPIELTDIRPSTFPALIITRRPAITISDLEEFMIYLCYNAKLPGYDSCIIWQGVCCFATPPRYSSC